jgi:hypothetical protein
MILKDIINKSYYGSVGYVNDLDSINLLEKYIIYNLPVLKEFVNIVTSTTYVDDNSELRIQLEDTWKKYFPNSIHIDTGISRGHSFGAADNDNAIIDYCKNNNIDWVCKSSNDIIINEIALNQTIEEVDFYYLNGVGYGGMESLDFDFEKIKNEIFYPQTNFYIINTSKIDYLNNKQYLDDTYKVTRFPEFNGRIWEYIKGWSCELFLKQCIGRNNLSKKHLVSDKSYTILLEVIRRFDIYDSSHKNIMLDGICHYHSSGEEIATINNI